MTFPYGPTDFDALTTDATISASDWGADSKAGSGDAKVAEPGLFSSAKCAKLSCDNQHVEFRVDVSSGTRTWVGFDFQVEDGAPDEEGPQVTPILRALDESDVVQAQAYFTLAGILKFRDDGSDAVGDTEFNYCGEWVGGNNDDPEEYVPGKEYHFLWRIDTAVGKQKAWIWRDGHFREVTSSGMPIGPNAVKYIDVGLPNSTSKFKIKIDNVFVTDVEQEIPEGIFVEYAIPGNPRPDGMDVCVSSAGYNSVRVRVFEPGAPNAILESDAVSVIGHGRATPTVSGLDPSTEYEFEVWGLRQSTWSDTEYGRGSFKTPPAAGYPASGLFFMTGCEFDKGISLAKDTTWTPALARGYDAWWHGGDENYKNNKTLAAGPFREGISWTFTDRPVFAEFASKTTNLGYNPSDHDGGGGQAADVQDPSTPYAIQAWGDSWPHADAWHPGECRSTSVTWGRIRFVMPDFRTLARSDSDDADTDAKLAYSAEDEAIIIAELGDDSHALVVLCFDQPWPGDAADVVPKDDHMANYPNQRARINAAIAARLARGMGVFIVQADYHGLVWRDPGTSIDDSTGGAGLIGIAGSWNNTGNIRPLDLPNYTGYWGEKQDPDPEFDIAVSGELEITDDGETITVVGRCIDNDNSVTRGTVTDSWVIPFVAPVPEAPSYDLGPLPLHSADGRFRLLSATQPADLPARTAAQTSIPFSDDTSWSHVYFDGGGTVLLQVGMFAEDRTERDELIDALLGVCASKDPITVGYRPDWTGPVTREATGQILSAVKVDRLSPTFARTTIAVELQGPSRAPAVGTLSVDMSDGNVSGVRVTALDGSTAPTGDYVFRMSGSCRTFRVLDVATQRWVRVTVPDDYFVGETDPDALPEDKAVIVDASSWSAWLIDADDGWNTDDGTAVDDWIDSTQNGTTVLALTPAVIDGDPFDRGVVIDINIGTPTGAPLFQIRTNKGAWFS